MESPQSLCCIRSTCKAFRTRLGNHSRRRWIFIESRSSLPVYPSDLTNYLMEGTGSEDPIYCTAMIDSATSPIYYTLLEVPSDAQMASFSSKLTNVFTGCTLRGYHGVWDQCNWVTPLLDCVNEVEGNTQLWISRLRKAEILLGQPELLGEFERDVNCLLRVMADLGADVALLAMVEQTPDSSF